VGRAASKFSHAEISSAINEETQMKRNAFASLKSLVVVKLAGLVAVAALSGCALTGPFAAGEKATDVTVEDIHWGA
jgi:hypothetical protein